MPRSAVSLVRLLPVAVPERTPTDVQLLRAFGATRGEDAFAEIVRRYGPMVLAACRRVLANHHDAEDAFQATFLVLVRKAETIHGATLAGWLYAVAVRTARGVRIMRERRRKHELAVANPALQGGAVPADPDLASVIDEELAQLPNHYREALVLCELRGLSRKEAAVELGIPEGTLSSRLAAAKKKLAERLSARGLATPATLAAALAPASVSASLLHSAVAALKGTAAPLASAAASAVVKAMLFDQLKAVILAVGILLTVVCGTWAMTGTPSEAPNPATTPALRVAENPAVKLVEQLGTDEFADRESAEKKLREMGLKAEPLLRAGLRSENPEVRERSAKLLTAVRTDARAFLVKNFDPTATAEPDHPIWKRFKTIAGNDAAARKLFAEIIADPRRLKLLDDADRDPAKAGELYAAELKSVTAYAQGFDEHPWSYGPDVTDRSAPAVAGAFYLGTYPASTGKVKDLRREGYLFTDTCSWPETVKSPVGPALKRIFAAWLPLRDILETREYSLTIAATHRVKEVLPFARKLLADEMENAAHRAQCSLLLGILGTSDDVPLLRRVAGSKIANDSFQRFNVILSAQQELSVVWAAYRFGMKDVPDDLKRAAEKANIRTCDRTVADCALAAAVKLASEKPEDMGFLWPHTALGEKINDDWFYHLSIHGFPTAEARTSAHAKAKAFLDKQPPEPKKAEPKPDGQLLRLDGHTGLVAGVAFFPTGDKIATSGYDATYRIWDAKTGKQLDERSTGTKESQVGGPVAVSPDGKRIAARYFVAEADTGKFLFGLEGHTGRITKIAYSTDGKRILTASHDGTVRVWDAEGKELQRFDAHMGQKVAVTSSGLQPREERVINRGAWDATFSKDRTRIVSGGVDGTVRVWDVDTAKELQCIKLDRVTVMAVAFMPDGKRVVSAGSDGIIRIWEAETGKELGKFEGHTGIIAALAVTADGKLLVSAGHDKTVRVWEAETGKELRCFRGHTAAVQAVAISPDGKTALSGGEDNTARLWTLPIVGR